MLRNAHLPAWPVRILLLLETRLLQATDRLFDPIPVEPDRYSRRMFLSLGLVLVLTLSIFGD